jgi:hypothetical protein
MKLIGNLVFLLILTLSARAQDILYCCDPVGKGGGVTGWELTPQDKQETRSISPRSPVQRNGGRVIPIQYDVPIQVVNAATGNPEIAPSCGVTIQGPFNQAASSATPQRELSGVSVRIGGIPALISQVSPNGISLIAPEGLPESGTVDVEVTAGMAIYRGVVKVAPIAPGIYRGFQNDSYQWWPLGIYRIGLGVPYVVSEKPIPPSGDGQRTVLQLICTGVRHAHDVSVEIDGVTVPLLANQPWFLPEQDILAIELPETLQGADRLAEVRLIADGKTANRIWLRLQGK